MVFGIFHKIVDFFGKFFTNQETKVTVLSLSELDTNLSSRYNKLETSLELECAKLSAEIKFLHGKTLAIINDVTKKELESKNNVRFNKAALSAKSNVEIQLLRTLEKINPKDRGKTIDDFKAYSEESISILVKEVIHFRKSIAYTSVYLKDEMKALGEVMQELLEKLQEVNKTLGENGAYFKIEKAKQEIKEIKILINAVEEETNKKDNTVRTITDKQTIVDKWKEKIGQFESGEKMSQIQQLENEKQKLLNEKQSLKTELSSLLSTIDKPLQRFSQLAESGRWKLTKEEKNTLDSFLTNPIIALRSDPKAASFKQILAMVVRAIEDEKIDFKEKEKEKKLAALNDIIAFDFFDKMFWKMNELQKKQIELDKKLSDNRAYEEIERLKVKQKDAQNELTNEEEKGKITELNLMAAEKKLSDKKLALETKSNEILKKTILIDLTK